MRRAAAFLALLLCLYWTRTQGESGGLKEEDVIQTEVQSEILSVKATSDQTNITPDIWAELKELRDIVRKLEQENTEIRARLTASEIKNAVLETRMNASDKKVEELERENADLKARLNSGQKVVEELKRDNTVLEAKLSSNELQVEEDKRQNAERPKVAFTVGLNNLGRLGPFNIDTTLKFSKIFTNIGQAYNPSTGVFTAPVRGTYYFRFNMWEGYGGNLSGIKLYHNDKQITFSYDRVISDGYATASNAFVLKLEKGDVIYLHLSSSFSVSDDTNNHTTFSGFLLFAM